MTEEVKIPSAQRGRPAGKVRTGDTRVDKAIREDAEAAYEARTLAGLVPEPGSEKAKADQAAAPKPRSRAAAKASATKAPARPAKASPAKPASEAPAKPKAPANGHGPLKALAKDTAQASARRMLSAADKEFAEDGPEVRAKIANWLYFLPYGEDGGGRWWGAANLPRPTRGGWAG
jgi:hypothetical protein